MSELERAAKWIYEATRIEAKWSKRRIVPEKWEYRDNTFELIKKAIGTS